MIDLLREAHQRVNSRLVFSETDSLLVGDHNTLGCDSSVVDASHVEKR